MYMDIYTPLPPPLAPLAPPPPPPSPPPPPPHCAIPINVHIFYNVNYEKF